MDRSVLGKLKPGATLVIVPWWDAATCKMVNLKKITNEYVETPIVEYGLFGGIYKGVYSELEHVTVIRESQDYHKHCEWTTIPMPWVHKIIPAGEAKPPYNITITESLVKKIRKSIKAGKATRVVIKEGKKAIKVIK